MLPITRDKLTSFLEHNVKLHIVCNDHKNDKIIEHIQGLDKKTLLIDFGQPNPPIHSLLENDSSIWILKDLSKTTPVVQKLLINMLKKEKKDVAFVSLFSENNEKSPVLQKFLKFFKILEVAPDSFLHSNFQKNKVS